MSVTISPSATSNSTLRTSQRPARWTPMPCRLTRGVRSDFGVFFIADVRGCQMHIAHVIALHNVIPLHPPALFSGRTMLMKHSRPLALAFAATAALCTTPAVALDGVVTSIKPVHSLVAAVMEGVGTPHLIVRASGSEHAYSLRPSDAGALQDARLIFWIGPQMETFLKTPIETLGEKAEAVELAAIESLTLLPQREGGPFEAPSHGDH